MKIMSSISTKAAGSAASKGFERCSGKYASITRKFVSKDNNLRPMSSGSASSDDEENYYGVWRPNRTTVAFERMERTCPSELEAYARCVIDKQNAGALTLGACEEQFREVMNCFRSVR